VKLDVLPSRAFVFSLKNLFVPTELIMSNNVESHIPIQSNPVITTPVYATPRL
jgi:hypothetical protein